MPKRIQQIKQVINQAKVQIIIILPIKTVPFMVWSTKFRKKCEELYKLDAKLTIFTNISTNMIKSSALQINSYPFLLAGLLVVAKSLRFRSKLAACLCVEVLARKIILNQHQISSYLQSVYSPESTCTPTETFSCQNYHLLLCQVKYSG